MTGGSRTVRLLRWAAIVVGGGALLAAMAVEVLAVAGRNFNVPLLGSIELIQAAVLIFASVAIAVASASRSHATIRLLLGRLPEGARRLLEQVNGILSAAFFLALIAGSAWIAADMWSGFEESELLGIPYRPLRIFSILCLCAVVILLLRDGKKGEGA